MRAVFESHGGTIEKIIGDAIVAVFGLPVRHDDDALRAVEAAAESQRALATLNDQLEADLGRPPRRPDRRRDRRRHLRRGEHRPARPDRRHDDHLLGDGAERAAARGPHRRLDVRARPRHGRGRARRSGHPEGLARHHWRRIAWSRSRRVPRRGTPRSTRPPPGMRLCPACGEENPDAFRHLRDVRRDARRPRRSSATAARRSRIVFADPKPATLDGDDAEPGGPARRHDPLLRGDADRPRAPRRDRREVHRRRGDGRLRAAGPARGRRRAGDPRGRRDAGRPARAQRRVPGDLGHRAAATTSGSTPAR